MVASAKKERTPSTKAITASRCWTASANLAPPLRLATMAFLASRNALRTNTAESIAQLTGGEFFHFHNAKDLKAGSSRSPTMCRTYYVLSFHPTAPTPGLHALHLEIKDLDTGGGRNANLVLRARREYWLEDEDKH